MSRFSRRGTCLTDGDLRAALDGQVSPSMTAHIEHCARCAKRLAVLRGISDSSATLLWTLVREEDHVDARAAYGRFRSACAQGELHGDVRLGGYGMKSFFQQRWARAVVGIAAAVVLMLAVTMSPMRTVANDFLDQLRVQKFAAVTIPMDLAQPMQSQVFDDFSVDHSGEMPAGLSGFGTFESTFQFDQDHMPQAMSVDQAAAQYAGMKVPTNLPDGFGADAQAYVTQAGSASYTMNVAKVRDLIHQMNLPIYAFDNVSSDTLTFAVDVPSAAVLRYQDADGKNLLVGQMDSPTLNIDKNFDMNALRDEVLQFPGLPADVVGQLRSVDDWEHTLIIPIPEGATSENVTIDGQPGLLIKSDEGNVVLWQKDGKLFAVGGQISSDSVLSVAKSLKGAR